MIMHVREFRDRRSFAHRDVWCMKQMLLEILEVECRNSFSIEIRDSNNRTVNTSYSIIFSSNTSLSFESFTTYELKQL